MTLHLWLADLAAYSAQIAAVVVAGASLPWLLRVHRPGAMLVYRQALLAVCLLLPLLQPWKRPSVETGDVSISTVTVLNAASHRSRQPSLEQVIALALCAGVLARLGWLAIGLARLRRHRRGAELLTVLPPVFEPLQTSFGVHAAIGLSTEVAGPVTFGIRKPVILLPVQFLNMPAGAQQAIACHEMAHIRRGDWVFTVAEEIVRALFWFHPCVWWLLGRSS